MTFLIMELDDILVKIKTDPEWVCKYQEDVGDAVAIATTTFYIEENPILRERAALAEHMIKEAKGLGYKVFAVDGGSTPSIVTRLEQAGAVIIPEVEHFKGILGPGRRQAIEAAYDSRPFVAWTEPEKLDYTRPEKLHHVSQVIKTVIPIAENAADLVVPRRKFLDSYPYLQQLAEQFGNGHWKDATGMPLDVWFGPRTFRGKTDKGMDVARFFLDYTGKSLDGKTDYGDRWESIFLPIIDARMNGARCIGIPVDYTHPSSQCNLEKGNPDYNVKRVEQLCNLVPTISKRWKEYQKE